MQGQEAPAAHLSHALELPHSFQHLPQAVSLTLLIQLAPCLHQGLCAKEGRKRLTPGHHLQGTAPDYCTALEGGLIQKLT